MSDEIEPVEEFRVRARSWIKANLGPTQAEDISQFSPTEEAELEAVARDRALQRKLFDAETAKRMQHGPHMRGMRGMHGEGGEHAHAGHHG